MLVKDLIEELSKHNPNTEVIINNGEYRSIVRAEELEIVRNWYNDNSHEESAIVKATIKDRPNSNMSEINCINTICLWTW